MKKLLITLAVALLSFGMAVAQQTKTITGYVVDKNGNPLPGAEVMATGGGASAMTDADGSFTLQVHPLLKKITASYAGMRDKTLKLKSKSDYIFTMKPEKTHPGFISILGTAGVNKEDLYDDYYAGGFGLMGGQLGKWGWYVKTQFSIDADDIYLTDFSAGVIKQLGKSKTSLYLGAGPAVFDSSSSRIGLTADFGAIFKVHSHINVIAGFNYSFGEAECDGFYDCHVFLLDVGVGYVF